MTREKLIVPVAKKKAGPPLKNLNWSFPNELRTAQYALEQAMKRIASLEKQCDGLSRLDKQREIQANLDRLAIKRMENRVYRGDDE